jgi:hypothetical protein
MLPPFDIINHIFEIVAINDYKTGGQPSLASCARVSHALHDLTAAHLYRHIHTNNACKTLLKRRDLAELVHSADFELHEAGLGLCELFDGDEEMDRPTSMMQPQPKMLRGLGIDNDVVVDIRAGDGRALVTAALRVLPNLRTLKLTINDPLDQYAGLLEPSLLASLPHLTTVQLNLGKGVLNDLTIAFHAFAIPTIHTLALTGLAEGTMPDPTSSLWNIISTVEHLVINTTGGRNTVNNWLCLPTRLVSFTSDVSIMPSSPPFPELNRFRDTLKSLVLTDSHRRHIHGVHIKDLVDFTALAHIDLPPYVLLKDTQEARSVPLMDRLPTSLRSVSFNLQNKANWYWPMDLNVFVAQLVKLVESRPLHTLILRGGLKNGKEMHKQLRASCERAGVEVNWIV